MHKLLYRATYEEGLERFRQVEASLKDAEQQRGWMTTASDDSRWERRLEHLSEQVLQLRRRLFCITCILGAHVVRRPHSSHFRKLYSERKDTTVIKLTKYAEYATKG